MIRSLAATGWPVRHSSDRLKEGNNAFKTQLKIYQESHSSAASHYSIEVDAELSPVRRQQLLLMWFFLPVIDFFWRRNLCTFFWPPGEYQVTSCIWRYHFSWLNRGRQDCVMARVSENLGFLNPEFSLLLRKTKQFQEPGFLQKSAKGSRAQFRASSWALAPTTMLPWVLFLHNLVI